HFLKGQLEF
ncbi:unnamed protein product, partial [Allacma fusca]